MGRKYIYNYFCALNFTNEQIKQQSTNNLTTIFINRSKSYFCSQRLLYHLYFQYFDLDRIRWRLLQKYVLLTTLYIYVSDEGYSRNMFCSLHYISTYLMKVTPEICSAHYIIYLRLYYYYMSRYTFILKLKFKINYELLLFRSIKLA